MTGWETYAAVALARLRRGSKARRGRPAAAAAALQIHAQSPPDVVGRLSRRLRPAERLGIRMGQSRDQS